MDSDRRRALHRHQWGRAGDESAALHLRDVRLDGPQSAGRLRPPPTAVAVPMKRYLGPPTWLFLGVWLVLLIGGRSRFFQDPGTFWHVSVGDRIIDVGFFDTDPYTFTFAGKPWIPHQWLGECTMAVLNHVGGFDTLLLATATLLA